MEGLASRERELHYEQVHHRLFRRSCFSHLFHYSQKAKKEVKKKENDLKLDKSNTPNIKSED